MLRKFLMLKFYFAYRKIDRRAKVSGSYFIKYTATLNDTLHWANTKLYGLKSAHHASSVLIFFFSNWSSTFANSLLRILYVSLLPVFSSFKYTIFKNSIYSMGLNHRFEYGIWNLKRYFVQVFIAYIYACIWRYHKTVCFSSHFPVVYWNHWHFFFCSQINWPIVKHCKCDNTCRWSWAESECACAHEH